jgi:hypothetical protein
MNEDFMKLMVAMGFDGKELIEGFKSASKAASGFEGALSEVAKSVGASGKKFSELAGHSDEAAKSLFTVSNATKLGLGAIVTAATAVTGAVTASTYQTMRYADSLNGMAQTTGMSISALERFGFAAAQSNTSLGAVQTGWRNMTRTLNEGSEKTKAAVAGLGLSFRDLKASTPEKQLDMVFQAINKLPSETQKTEAAMTMFGSRMGASLKALIKNSADANAQFAKLGIGLGDAGTKAAAEMNDKFTVLGKVVETLSLKFGNIFTSSPAMREALDWVTEKLAGLGKYIDMHGKAVQDVLGQAWAMFKRIIDGLFTPAARMVIDYGSKMVKKLIELSGAFFDMTDAARVASTAIIAFAAFEGLGFLATWAGSVRDFGKSVIAVFAAVKYNLAVLVMAFKGGELGVYLKAVFDGALAAPFITTLLAVTAAVYGITSAFMPAASASEKLEVGFKAVLVGATALAYELVKVAQMAVAVTQAANPALWFGPGAAAVEKIQQKLESAKLAMSDFANETARGNPELAEKNRLLKVATMELDVWMANEQRGMEAATAGREKKIAADIAAKRATEEATKANIAFAESLGFKNAAKAEQEIMKITDMVIKMNGSLNNLSDDQVQKVVSALMAIGTDGAKAVAQAILKTKEMEKSFKDNTEAIRAATREIERYTETELKGLEEAEAAKKRIAQLIKDGSGVDAIAQIEQEMTALQANVDKGINPTIKAWEGMLGKLDDLILQYPHATKEIEAMRLRLVALNTTDAVPKETLEDLPPVIKKATERTNEFGKALDAAKNLMDVLGIEAKSTLGVIIGGMAAASHAGKTLGDEFAKIKKPREAWDFSKLAEVDWSQVIQGIAGVIGAFKNATDSANGFKRALGGAMVGMNVGGQIGESIAGDMGKGWGQRIGFIVGGIAGLLRGAPTWAKVGKEVGAMFGAAISEELAKQIEADAKKLKLNVSSAGLLNIIAIAKETGQSIRGMGLQVQDLMMRVKSGAIPAAEGIKAIGEAWGEVRAEAEKYEIVGDRVTVMMLKQARANGQMTAEMKAFSKEQVELAVSGANKIAAGLVKALGGAGTKEAVEKWFGIYKAKYEELKKLGSNLTESQAADMKQFEQLMNAQQDKLNSGKFSSGQDIGSMGKDAATLFMGAFNAAVAEEGWVKATESMREGFEQMKAALGDDEAAMALLAPFERFVGYLDNEVIVGLLTIADGTKDVITGLANAGYLSAEQFQAATGLINSAYEKMNTEGVLAKDSLLAVAPALAAAISASQQYGIPLDEKTEALKAAAEAAGIQFPIDPLLQVRDVLVSIAEALGAKIPESARQGGDAVARHASASSAAQTTAAQQSQEAWQSGLGTAFYDTAATAATAAASAAASEIAAAQASADAWKTGMNEASDITKEAWSETAGAMMEEFEAAAESVDGITDSFGAAVEMAMGLEGGVDAAAAAAKSLSAIIGQMPQFPRPQGGGYIPEGTPTGPLPPDLTAATGFYSPSMPRGPHAEGMTNIGVHPGEEVIVNPKGAPRASSVAAPQPDNVFHISVNLPGGEVLKFVERASKNRQLRIHSNSVKRF